MAEEGAGRNAYSARYLFSTQRRNTRLAAELEPGVNDLLLAF